MAKGRENLNRNTATPDIRISLITKHRKSPKPGEFPFHPARKVKAFPRIGLGAEESRATQRKTATPGMN
jgi:hypothetical protein